MVRITNIRACQPVTPVSPADWRTDLGQILVAVDTDAGVTGYGVGGGGFSGIHVVQTVLRDLLLNRPLGESLGTTIAACWDDMYQSTLAFGQKGLAVMAISGVDLALWDLRGKLEGVPVHTLLGGKRAETLPTYVTVWSREGLEAAVGGGHAGFKLHLEKLGHRLADSAEHDAAARSEFAEQIAREIGAARTLVGDRSLMADAWMGWSLPVAETVLDQLQASGLVWMEEPLPIDDVRGYASLVASQSIPIAGGEHEYTSAAFAELASRRLHDVLQPDVCWCGGLTELVRVYEIGREHNIRVCPHRGAELWSLHAMAALDPDPLAESGRAWMTWVEGQPSIESGVVRVPDEPGFGVQIDEAMLEVYPAPALGWSKRTT